MWPMYERGDVRLLVFCLVQLGFYMFQSVLLPITMLMMIIICNKVKKKQTFQWPEFKKDLAEYMVLFRHVLFCDLHAGMIQLPCSCVWMFMRAWCCIMVQYMLRYSIVAEAQRLTNSSSTVYFVVTESPRSFWKRSHPYSYITRCVISPRRFISLDSKHT